MQETIRLLRAAQAYSVALYDDQYRRLDQAGALIPIGESGAVALADGYYDAQAGVQFDENNSNFTTQTMKLDIDRGNNL